MEQRQETLYSESVEFCRGGDPSAVLHALKFALAHPLVEDDGSPAPHHQKMTASIAKKRTLKPIEKSEEAKESEQKIQQIQSIESILHSMKSRLHTVESNLMATVKVQAEAEASAAAAKAKAEGSGNDSGASTPAQGATRASTPTAA
ncbi:hypothetical protein CYMTET_25274 [Cymbomonas tetramitiformis]|uniref:Uncharacterized protein n=1 Tax=Cymbomonas tetramitiformis TaxID=36881 RepID=A0AAE0FUD3_9CHLO|nr:hypothetical protein CYMTET_25274 [Cymbomonas tetramitiformis]